MYGTVVVRDRKKWDTKAVEVISNLIVRDVKVDKWQQLINMIAKKSKYWSKINKGYRKYYYWCLAILESVRKGIMYQPDPMVEKFKTPQSIIDNGYGDCDDFTVLLSLLFLTLGRKVRLVLAGYRRRKDKTIPFTHIYCRVNIGNKWYTADGVIKNRKGFVEKKGAIKKKVFEITHKGLVLIKPKTRNRRKKHVV